MFGIRGLLICPFLLLLTFQITSCEQQNETAVGENTGRDGKVFSLFSIVAFKNTGCRSASAMTTGQSTARNGTCYTSSECSAKGGTASGNCAAGFGVCCLFLVSASGSTVNQNCTYIRNPSFPNVYASTTSITYTVQKCTTDICYLRLDFEQFVTLGPRTNTDEVSTSGGLCQDDNLVFTTTSGQTIPSICGVNTGQHIYVDVGNAATDSLTMAFTFGTTSTTRIWEIKVSQIECSNTNRPPSGCLQYVTGLTGRITTFNFFNTGIRQAHLAGQDVTACIRRQSGYCCIQYQKCGDVQNGFTIDKGIPTNALGALVPAVDSNCSLDYVVIPSASASCSSTSGTVLYNKFCSPMLDPFNSNLGLSFPVCSCASPFQVHFHTDTTGLTVFPGIVSAAVPRGVCLDYMQVPC